MTVFNKFHEARVPIQIYSLGKPKCIYLLPIGLSAALYRLLPLKAYQMKTECFPVCYDPRLIQIRIYFLFLVVVQETKVQLFFLSKR